MSICKILANRNKANCLYLSHLYIEIKSMSTYFENMSFDEVFLKFKERFIRFSRAYVSDRQVAEDIVTDAFIAYWENRARLSDNTNIPAYILTVIRNKCLTYLRDAKLHEDILADLVKVEEWKLQMQIASLEACNPFEIFTMETYECVRKAFCELLEKTRKVFWLSRYESKTHKEIASELEISIKTVEFHITKATKMLKDKLKDYFPILLLFI